MASANDRLADAAVSHQIGLQRYSAATVRKALALLARSEARIVERLARGDLTTLSRARQEALLEAIRAMALDGVAVLTGYLAAEMGELALYERDYQIRTIREALPIDLDTVAPTAAQVKAAVDSRPFQGRLLREWYGNLGDTAAARLRNAIRMGIVEGRTSDQVVREVRGTRALGYRDGILQVNRRAAESVVRTAINHTATAARGAVYEANAGVIKGVQWVATLDARTTLVCAGRDGKVYPVDSGPRPPAHFGCRSSTAPVLKSWRELGIDLAEAPEGTRASLNGQVPASTTFDGWLRRQPVAMQNDVLGPERAVLFRKGDLPIDRFTDRSGREYTLDELRRREAEAFERAAA